MITITTTAMMTKATLNRIDFFILLSSTDRRQATPAIPLGTRKFFRDSNRGASLGHATSSWSPAREFFASAA
jgi:hypothetical protein